MNLHDKTILLFTLRLQVEKFPGFASTTLVQDGDTLRILCSRTAKTVPYPAISGCGFVDVKP